jgi:hypothetical protein
LCEEMQAHHKLLLLYLKVRRLSRGKFVKWLVELKEEVRRFLQDSDSPLYQHFLDKKWLAGNCFSTFWQGLGIHEKDDAMEKPLW